MKLRMLLLALGSLLFVQQAIAGGVTITEIHHPQFAEAQALQDGAWVVVADIQGLNLPVSARPSDKGADMLVFKVGKRSYAIPRADVTLANERLVTDACATIAATLDPSAKAASVKGAGEGCE